MGLKTALRLETKYREYLWGGKRLRPGDQTTAEAWVISEEDSILSGAAAGMTLSEAATQYGVDLLGTRPLAQTGKRFPLLIKLLDCAAWLSLQVHPDDAFSRHMEGANKFGKTEAWFFIDSIPGAEILCGLKPGTTAEQMQQAIRQGTLLDYMHRLQVQPGDSIYIPSRMIHALGPGLLVYEVQQTSDITYRVYDWGRPQTEKRPLHIEQSIAVADATLSGSLLPSPAFGENQCNTLINCSFFTLKMLTSSRTTMKMDTRGETFHILTILTGSARIHGEGWSESIYPLESILVPADCGAYEIEPQGEMRLLVSSIEPVEKR